MHAGEKRGSEERNKREKGVAMTMITSTRQNMDIMYSLTTLSFIVYFYIRKEK